MTQEEKDLLLKDLCSRLPYGVMVNINGEIDILTSVCNDDEYYFNFIEPDNSEGYSIEDIKPYLFPLSSITEEQAIELFNIFGISLVNSVGANYIKVNEITGITFFFQNGFDVETHFDKLINWLNKNHFDYRGLIPMGLAIDATDKNIY